MSIPPDSQKLSGGIFIANTLSPMIFFATIYLKTAIYLLHQQEPYHLVGKGHRGKTQPEIRRLLLVHSPEHLVVII